MSEKIGKIRNLYRRANDIVNHIGSYGEIDSRHTIVDELMDALKDLDGGVFDLDWLTNIIERKG